MKKSTLFCKRGVTDCNTWDQDKKDYKFLICKNECKDGCGSGGTDILEKGIGKKQSECQPKSGPKPPTHILKKKFDTKDSLQSGSEYELVLCLQGNELSRKKVYMQPKSIDSDIIPMKDKSTPTSVTFSFQEPPNNNYALIRVIESSGVPIDVSSISSNELGPATGYYKTDTATEVVLNFNDLDTTQDSSKLKDTAINGGTMTAQIQLVTGSKIGSEMVSEKKSEKFNVTTQPLAVTNVAYDKASKNLTWQPGSNSKQDSFKVIHILKTFILSYF